MRITNIETRLPSVELYIKAAFARVHLAAERHNSILTLNQLQRTVEAAGIEPAWHADPEQDIWRQMDQIRLKLAAS